LKCLLNAIFSAGLIAVIAGWGRTNVTSKKLSSRLKVLKVEIVESNVCRRRFRSFKKYHICAAATGMEINQAVCHVSNKCRTEDFTQNVCIQSLKLAV
jgi:Trypsin